MALQVDEEHTERSTMMKTTSQGKRLELIAPFFGIERSRQFFVSEPRILLSTTLLYMLFSLQLILFVLCDRC